MTIKFFSIFLLLCFTAKMGTSLVSFIITQLVASVVHYIGEDIANNCSIFDIEHCIDALSCYFVFLWGQ